MAFDTLGLVVWLCSNIEPATMETVIILAWQLNCKCYRAGDLGLRLITGKTAIKNPSPHFWVFFRQGFGEQLLILQCLSIGRTLLNE